MNAPPPSTALKRLATVASRLVLVVLLGLIGYVGWLVLNGDPALPLGKRVEQQLLWLFVLAPLVILWILTLIVGAVASGRLAKDGSAGGVEVGDSGFGSLGSDR